MKEDHNKIFDELLVLKCQSGDRQSLTLLIKRWHQKLLRQANRHLYDTEASKDVVQDSWQAIIKGLNKLESPSKFGVWALSITSRKAIDLIRKNQSIRRRDDQLEYDDDYAHIDAANEREEKLAIMRQAISKLPEDQKLVLSMYYLESHSLSEISAILSVPMGTVKSRLYYAREHLKKLMKTSTLLH